MNIYDIAKKAGVSIATVSRVINGKQSVSEKTRKKVNNVMSELGYTPNVFARGLMVNSMRTLGVLTSDVRDLYYANAIHTVESEAREKGYDVILCCTGNDIGEKRKYLELLLQKRVDGIILIGSVFKEKSDNRHILEAARKVPVVMMNGCIDGKNVYCVLCDDSYAVYNTVKYLFDMGHRDIVYIYDTDSFSGMEKIKGFKKAAAELGIDIRANSTIKTTGGIEGGYKAVEKLIGSGEKFSAVITAEDILAVGVLKKLEHASLKVPDDIAVVGFNNSIISECTNPALTSIDNKVEAISSNAVKIMIDALEGKNIPFKTVVMPELVIRNTT